MRGVWLPAGDAPGAGAMFAATVPATLTVADCVSTWSLGPLTVMVYVVVTLGDSVFEPRGRTFPSAGSMVTLVGFSTAQVSVTAWPGLMDSGVAANFSMRAGSCAARA